MRTFLFQLNPLLGLKALVLKHLLGFKLISTELVNKIPTKIMGIEFPNQIGLAAGLDTDGEHLNVLRHLGFGFIEIGTITPKAQLVDNYPRISKLPNTYGLINRVGLVNKGVESLHSHLSNINYQGVLGINIGKNDTTTPQYAFDDYKYCLQRLHKFASYFTLNICWYKEDKLFDNFHHQRVVANLFNKIKQLQLRLADKSKRYVPITIKFANDISSDGLNFLLDNIIANKFDGVVVAGSGIYAKDNIGFLSGGPIRKQSEFLLMQTSSYVQGAIPIISTGGIITASDVTNRLARGASLVQLYTGFVYFGPKLIKRSSTVLLPL